MILSAKPPIPPIAASALLNEVLQELAQDQNLLRIKKLLLFVCTHNWENNPQRLEQADLQELVQRLMAIAPTLEQLQSQLHSIAKSLNKSAEYSLVANTIINHINRLYLEQPTHRVGTRQRDYQAVAALLTHDSSPNRVKKLLLLASRNVWATDPESLQQLSLLDLIREVHSLTPTPESLRASLENLVKTLSKPAEYAAVADRVSQAFQPLYLVKFSPPMLEVASPAAADDATELMGMQPRVQPIVRPIPCSAPSESGDIQQGDLSDLFDLRLELMRSSNPFKVKILLFSVLHETFQPGQEQMLKSYELDDLLRILLQTHKLLNQLNSKLFSAARLLPDPADYFQVAQTVLQATRSFYRSAIANPSSHPASDFNSSLNSDLDNADADNPATVYATGIVSLEASLAGTTAPGKSQSKTAFLEHTCQILPFKTPC